MQCTTSCCDRTSELQPDNVDKGDFSVKGNSNNIMKPKKNPATFNAQDITGIGSESKCLIENSERGME